MFNLDDFQKCQKGERKRSNKNPVGNITWFLVPAVSDQISKLKSQVPSIQILTVYIEEYSILNDWTEWLGESFPADIKSTPIHRM